VGNSPTKAIDYTGLEKLIFFPPGDSHYRGAMSEPDDADVLTIYAHGNPEQINGREQAGWMNAQQLADYIQHKYPHRKFKKIVLNSCRSGEGDNSIAQQLAVDLHTIVVGADNKIWEKNPITGKDFDHPYPPLIDTKRFGIPNLFKQGHWVVYSPRGRVTEY